VAVPGGQVERGELSPCELEDLGAVRDEEVNGFNVAILCS